VSRVCLYYRLEAERDRWLPGDRYVRPTARRIVHGRPRADAIGKVFRNLCSGLDRLGISYKVNLPFDRLLPDDRIGVIGKGRASLAGYDRPNPIVAGIGLMTHPSEWPSLCEDYPVVAYLQHSEWASEVYKPYFGDRCRVWPVGIDTDNWRPTGDAAKSVDCLIYDKIHWQRELRVKQLLDPIRCALQHRGLSYVELRYGEYDEATYKSALRRCRLMVFLCEHESQGLAYQECLASDVPILAWDHGWYLDPNRLAWGQPDIPATSVPYFDARCGLRFRDAGEFNERLGEFLDLAHSGAFAPRQYVIENLTLEKCSRHFLEILDEAQSSPLYASSTGGY
jgi:glycosyltransferase involved in cell wall biosynthesis